MDCSDQGPPRFSVYWEGSCSEDEIARCCSRLESCWPDCRPKCSPQCPAPTACCKDSDDDGEFGCFQVKDYGCGFSCDLDSRGSGCDDGDLCCCPSKTVNCQNQSEDSCDTDDSQENCCLPKCKPSKSCKPCYPNIFFNPCKPCDPCKPCKPCCKPCEPCCKPYDPCNPCDPWVTCDPGCNPCDPCKPFDLCKLWDPFCNPCDPCSSKPCDPCSKPCDPCCNPCDPCSKPCDPCSKPCDPCFKPCGPLL